MKALMIAAAAMAAAPALAQTPSLGNTLTPVEGGPQTRTTVIGPSAIGFTDRWGSQSSSVDYGSLTLTNNQRLVSLGDLGYTMGASSYAIMRDSISVRGPRQMVRFVFDVTPRLSARATGFGMTRAFANHSLTVAFTDLAGGSASFSASYFLQDRPSAAATLFRETGFQSNFLPIDGSSGMLEFVSGTGLVNKRTRYALTLPMFASAATEMAVFARCDANLVAQRALDTGTLGCGTSFRWIGASGLNGPVRLDSVSGQDWTRTYRPPAAMRMASAAGAFSAGAQSAVPEPGAWALMILGFGAVGLAARRRAPTRGHRAPIARTH